MGSETVWHSGHDLEMLRQKIKIFVKCKGLEILRSRTLLDSGFDLDFVVWNDSGFCGLDWVDALSILSQTHHSFLHYSPWCYVADLVLHRAARLFAVSMCKCACLCSSLLPSLLGSLWD